MTRVVLSSAVALFALCTTPALALQMAAPSGSGSSMPSTSTPPATTPMPPAAPSAGSPETSSPMQQTAPMGDNSNAATTSSTSTLPAPSADAMNKTYPVCTAQLQDSCINRSQAHRGHMAHRSSMR